MDEPSEPRWLDAEEQRTWLATASALSRLPVALDAQLHRDAGISHFEYLVMAVLSMTPGSTLRMSMLAEFTDSTLSRLSNVVTRLEKRGWVQRSPDPDDGRYTLATLTDDGRRKVVDTAPGHVAEVRRLVLDPLTKAQQTQLRRICHSILTTIDPDSCSPDSRFRRLLPDSGLP